MSIFASFFYWYNYFSFNSKDLERNYNFWLITESFSLLDPYCLFSKIRFLLYFLWINRTNCPACLEKRQILWVLVDFPFPYLVPKAGSKCLFGVFCSFSLDISIINLFRFLISMLNLTYINKNILVWHLCENIFVSDTNLCLYFR